MEIFPLRKGFNDDDFIKAEIERLKQKWNIKLAIETGTNYGFTTLELARMFDRVISMDTQAEYVTHARLYLERENVHHKAAILNRSSTVVLEKLDPSADHPILFYLDAHWESYCPLLDEIRLAGKITPKPIIVIHDFLVPNRPELGYDTYNGQPFTLEWVTPALDECYGVGNWEHYYNDKAEGAMRGVLYVEPKISEGL